jgi:hypothetical protein
VDRIDFEALHPSGPLIFTHLEQQDFGPYNPIPPGGQSVEVIAPWGDLADRTAPKPFLLPINITVTAHDVVTGASQTQTVRAGPSFLPPLPESYVLDCQCGGGPC